MYVGMLATSCCPPIDRVDYTLRRGILIHRDFTQPSGVTQKDNAGTSTLYNAVSDFRMNGSVVTPYLQDSRDAIEFSEKWRVTIVNNVDSPTTKPITRPWKTTSAMYQCHMLSSVLIVEQRRSVP